MAIHLIYNDGRELDADVTRALEYLYGRNFVDNQAGAYNSPEGHIVRFGERSISISVNLEADLRDARELVSGLVSVARPDKIFPDSQKREAAFLIDSLQAS